MTRSIAARLRDLLPYLGLLAVVVFFSATSDYFLSIANFQRLATDSATLLLVAFGMTLLILVGEIDLSVGAVVSLLSVVMAQVMAAGFPWPLSVAAGLALATLIGAANGALTVFGRIPSFIVTLGMLSVATGLAFILTGSISVAIMDVAFLDLFYSVRVLWIPVPLVLVAIGFAAVWVLMNRTVAGRFLFAIGANLEAARLSGVPVQRLKVTAFVIMGVLVGVASVLSAARLGSGAPDARPILTLDAIAAVIIGGASLYGGWASVTRTLVGALLIAVLNNGLVLLNIPTDAQYIVKGVIILIAVVLDRLAQGAKS